MEMFAYMGVLLWSAITAFVLAVAVCYLVENRPKWNKSAKIYAAVSGTLVVGGWMWCAFMFGVFQ
jgi:hypothetical protein